jgi:hypothetical protein
MTIVSLQVEPVGLAPLVAATMLAPMASGNAVRSSTRRRFIGPGQKWPLSNHPMGAWKWRWSR